MLKMNDLVKLSQTPKSTILYYVKEGLLPEPLKDKPNFHLYDEQCVQIIDFIKYLQSKFNANISQIKRLFSEPHFDFHKPYESLIASLSIIMGADNGVVEKNALAQRFDLTESELDQFVAMGLLFPRDGVFSATEQEMLAIYLQANDQQRSLIQQYLQTAKQLAALEVELGLALQQNEAEKNDAKLKQMLDVLLVLKPYLFNLQTFHTYQQQAGIK